MPSTAVALLYAVAISPFHKVLQQSDVISLLCPLTESSKGLSGASELDLMKPGALPVNTARTTLVGEQALVAALRSGHLGGAALDM